MTSLLRTELLTVHIGSVNVCQDLSLEIEPGQCWAVIGRNGVGKTTLLHVLGGLRDGDRGSVYYGDKSASEYTPIERARFVGVVLQHDENSFPISVRDTVIQGRYPHRRRWAGYTALDYAESGKAIERFELTGLAERDINRLSGGERRRVALATVFAQEPRLFLLDEPGAHLDVSHHLHFLQTLKSHLEATRCAAVLVMHDLHLAARFCDHALLLLGQGESVAGRIGQVLTEQTLEQAFQHPIIRCETSAGTVFLPR